MYISNKDLKKLVKEHNIRGCSEYTKSQLMAKLKSKGIISEEIYEYDNDPNRYKFLKGIKNGIKKVEVKNLETGDIRVYPSIYSCAKALKVNPGTIKFFDKRLYDDNLEITILDKEL